jgi:transcriptional regulator with XRE-family HTH domain
MTQVELADAVGMRQPAVARIEQGHVSPKATTVEQLLRATGHELSVTRLLGQDVDRPAVVDSLRLTPVDRVRLAIKKGMGRRRTDLIRIMRRLRRYNVRFVLVGDLAAAAHGAPTPAMSVEICIEPGPENAERIGLALGDLDGAEIGALAMVETPAGTEGFADLRANAIETLVGVGLVVRVAALDDLIRIVRTAGRPEKRTELEILGALRDQR